MPPMALRRRSGGWSERSRRTCFISIILVALFLWAALLVRMVASSPSAPSPYSKGPPPCESAPRVMWAPRVVLPSGTEPSAIHVAADGKIAKAWPSSREDAEAYAQTRGVSFEPLGFGDVISPGVVDAAAHLAEWLEPPGRSYEGFSSGTQAAAAGGITTVVDLPAHARPLTTTAEHLQRKVEATRGRLHVDVGFWGAALPENLDLAKLSALLRHGALGLTAVVAASPSVEQPGVMPGTRALALPELEVAVAAAAASGKPVLMHAEVVSDDDAGLPAGADGMDYASWLATRPLRWEEGAMRAVLSLAAQPQQRHVTQPHEKHQRPIGAANGEEGGGGGGGGGTASSSSSSSSSAQHASDDSAAGRGGRRTEQQQHQHQHQHRQQHPPPQQQPQQRQQPQPPQQQQHEEDSDTAVARTHTPRIHVLRLTDSAAMPLLNRANAAMSKAVTPEGVEVNRVTVGSCPHYMMFDAETVVRGDTRLKVAPPLRDALNRKRLWAALLDGSVAVLASDHTPATLEERAGSFFDAFTGISGLQFTLPATWTEGREHGATLRNLSVWLSEGPAKLAGIWTQKGSIEAGKDADLVVWRPEARTDTAAVFHRQPGSPYEDLSLYGRVMETVLRGRVVFRDGTPPLSTCGVPILRAE